MYKQTTNRAVQDGMKSEQSFTKWEGMVGGSVLLA